ncbi:zinc finger protein 160 [Thalassophryne amazonica]|uniref:zinc finger protein 160 n=1 Tax=Thalassophryne amazonica TaxID=390379 RepID=UPI0014708E52|nr:zinc finger protein 160 [Thalassophryne amazonica]
MENCSFQAQLLSVMEILARAAVAEINRRVDDGCAVLRLEVSRSRRDIEALKKKCDTMEAELRRTRMRARRKVFYPPAAERCAPLVKLVLNKDREITVWDGSMDAVTQSQQPPQCTDLEPAHEAEVVQIKEETAEDEDTWRNQQEDNTISEAVQPPCFDVSQPAQTDDFVECYHSAENPTNLGSLLPPSGDLNTFPEQHLTESENDSVVLVKHEEKQRENAVPLDSRCMFVVEEANGQLWSNQARDAGDPGFSYTEQQFEPVSSLFTSQSGLHLNQCSSDDVVLQIHSEKLPSLEAGAARAKKRVKVFGSKPPQPAHVLSGHDASSSVNSTDQNSVPFGEPAPPTGNECQNLLAANPTASAPILYGHSRSNFGVAKRMRTPWRCGVGEKRFGCTYCDKNFTRFSQLKEHLRSHTGEKPFSCAQCGRSFTKHCNLIRHAVVHSGEKPYGCALCGKCFTQRSSLTSHQKTAH